MKKVILSVLLGFGIMGVLIAMEPGEDVVTTQVEVKPVATGPMVTITTSDDKKFELPLSLLKQMPTIQAMMEDIDEEHQGIPIPLPTITSHTFKYIQDMLLGRQIDFEKISNHRLRQIVNAADYLGMETLQRKMLQALVDRLQGNKAEFNKLVFQLSFASQNLLWQQSSAYKYFSAPYKFDELSIAKEIVYVSPHGDRLAAKFFSGRGGITLWNAASRITQQLRIDNAIVYFIADKIIGHSWTGGINVWDLKNLDQPPHEFQVDPYEFFTVSSDEKKLITWNLRSPFATIWNFENLEELPRKITHEGLKNVITSGNVLITLNSETIKIWNLNDLDKKPRELSYKASFASLSADGNTLMAWLRDSGTIRVWNINQLEKGFNELKHEDVRIVSAGVGVHSNIVVSTAFPQKELKIWDLNNPDKPLRDVRDMIIDGFFITDDRLIVYSKRSKRILIWNLNNLHQTPYVVPLNYSKNEFLENVTVSADGSTLVTCSLSSIQLWKLIPMSEFDTLNSDQIAFLTWLYDNKDALLMAQLDIVDSDEYKATYQTLSNNLRMLIQNLFPNFEMWLAQQSGSEVEEEASEDEQPESVVEESSLEEEPQAPEPTSKRSRFFDRFKRSKK